MIQIYIPKPIKVESILIKNLQEDWNAFPTYGQTQQIGDDFIVQNKAPVLKVPSAVVKGDFNYLLNPNHPDFNQIKISEISGFPFDRRMFK